MKTYLLFFAMISVSNFAFAGNGGVGSVGGGILSCQGYSSESHKTIHVIINATEQTVSIDGNVSSVQFEVGPEQHTLAVGNESVFIGISTKDYKKAILNTKTIEQLVLQCDGNPL